MDMTPCGSGSSRKERDLDRVETSAWPQRLFPTTTRTRGETGVPIVVRQSVFNEIHRHGKSRTDVEVCGVLVGNGYRDEGRAFLVVEASIRGEHASHASAQVTFTAETWSHIHDTMDRDYAGLRILGWYHTHPGFGIFLSPMDLFIHENFFASAEQLALVYDPLGGDEGVFVWREGQPVREEVLIEADAPEDVTESPMTRFSPPLNAAGDSNLQDRMERVERRQSVLQLALASLAVAGSLCLVVFLVILRTEVTSHSKNPHPTKPQRRQPAARDHTADPSERRPKPPSAREREEPPEGRGFPTDPDQKPRPHDAAQR